MLFFTDRKHEKDLLEAMKDKFLIVRGVCGLDVPSICDPTIRFVMKALACKLMRKCRKDQVFAGMIAMSDKCVEGVTMSWEPFLLNQFSDRLHGITGQRYGIPLFLVVTHDQVSNVERNRGYVVFGYVRKVILGHQVSKLVVNDAQGTTNRQHYQILSV
jgi:hypothetical protein